MENGETRFDLQFQDYRDMEWPSEVKAFIRSELAAQREADAQIAEKMMIRLTGNDLYGIKIATSEADIPKLPSAIDEKTIREINHVLSEVAAAIRGGK